MTLSSNSWAKIEGDKSGAIPSFAEGIYVQVCYLLAQFFSVHSWGPAPSWLSYYSTSWRQHERAVNGIGACSCKAALAMGCKSLILTPFTITCIFLHWNTFSPLLNTDYILELLTWKLWTQSPLPFGLHLCHQNPAGEKTYWNLLLLWAAVQNSSVT